MNEQNWPTLSVVIPVYNGEDTISDCINSLLKQNYPLEKFEIIVVNNNSTDKTEEVVKELPVTYIEENTKKGCSPARNTGVQYAKNEWLLFFDADQLASEDYFKKLLSGYGNEEYGAFTGRLIGINTSNSFLGDYWENEWMADITKGNIRSYLRFEGGHVVIKKENFCKVGGFDEKFITCEDTDLAWRIQQNLGLKIKYNPDATALHAQRTSLKSLLKREFGLGLGGYLLGLRYKEAKKTILYSLWNVIKRTFIGLIALILKIIKLIFKKSSIREIKVLLLDIAMIWANLFGRIYAIIRRLKV